MVNTCSEYIFIFFVYAFLGWSMETVYMRIKEKYFTKRGFLLGPCCPIYGVGLVGITMFFQGDTGGFWVDFFAIIVLCSTLEYTVSLCMERVFHTRWWDYHDMKFNIRGRICLETMLPFGIFGTISLYRINPILMEIYHKIPQGVSNKLLVGLTIFLLIDLLISLRILHTISLPTGEADHTAEISKRVREALTNRFE